MCDFLNRNNKYIFFLFIIFLSVQVNVINAQDWPYWRGPHRNGMTDDTNWTYKALDNKIKILWKTNVGKGYSSLTIHGDYLYTMGNNELVNKVSCVDTRTGKEVWIFEFESSDRFHYGALSTPVYENNCVYISCRNGNVLCLDASTGKQKWHINIIKDFDAERPKYGFSGSPVIEDDLMILNAGKYGLALDKRTGEKIWGDPGGRAGYATPVIYTYRNEKCAMIFSHRCLHAVRISDGELLWKFPWVFNDGADSPDPVVVGNRVFISTAYRNGAAMINFEDNKPIQQWFKNDIQNEFGSSIFVNDYLYVPHGDTRHRTAYLKCIDFNTGEEKWSEDTGHCSIIYINHKFIVLNQWGELTIAEADEHKYTVLARAKIVETSEDVRCWTAPVLAAGKLYVRTNRGDLICVDVSN